MSVQFHSRVPAALSKISETSSSRYESERRVSPPALACGPEAAAVLICVKTPLSVTVELPQDVFAVLA